MEDIINEIKLKAAAMEVYADILEYLDAHMHWYQHEETKYNDDGEEVKTGKWIDDEGDYAEAHLRAYRETIKAVKKLAGV